MVRLASAVLLLTLGVYASAQKVHIDTLRVNVNFRQSSSDLDPAFMSNGQSLTHFVDAYSSLNCDCDTPTIHIKGFASPEGTLDFNRRLSLDRGNAISAYLTNNLGIPQSRMEIHPLGEDWTDLYNAVVKDAAVPDRVRAIDIIANGHSDTRKAQLKRLDDGRTWAYLLKHIFPSLRGAYAEVYCITKLPDVETFIPTEPYKLEVADSLICAKPDTIVAHQQEVVVEDTIQPIRVAAYPILAVRSNLLLPLLNVGIDVPIGAHWTLGADYYYPWIWPKGSNKSCFELTYFSGEARYWFNAANGEVPGKNYMVGHSVAAYGAWGYYDIERNYKGHQGNGWSAGVDYMYALPIVKGKLRLEFQVAVGYVGSRRAIPYTVYEYGGRLIRERGVHKNFSYFGPTKLSVSLALPINRKVKQSAPDVP